MMRLDDQRPCHGDDDEKTAEFGANEPGSAIVMQRECSFSHNSVPQLSGVVKTPKAGVEEDASVWES